MERLIRFFTPEVYNLHLEINRETETVDGDVRIFGYPHADFVKFHAVNIKIKNISVRKFDENVDYLNNKNLSEYLPCDFEQKNGEIKIKNFYHTENDPENYILEYKISFEYKINNNLQGCYLSNYKYNNEIKKIVTTQFESHYAREAFPCIDEPEAKAKFHLSLKITDLKDDDIVIANTELKERDGNEFIFEPSPRMSTYLLAWVVGPFKSISAVNKHGVKVTSYAALNQTTSSLEFANEVACRSLDYYNEKFGIKYPLNKLDQVALPDFEAGAMENWGLVTYRESCMLAEPTASVDTKSAVATTITHELSHQWFGDLVTMKWWDDLWLNESFATIMQYYSADELYPELNVWQDFFTNDCVAALRRDSLRGVQAVKQDVHDPTEIATLFDGAIVYAKGARLILMLIRLMGEEKFLKGVHDYFERYQYQNTVGDDLWAALQPYADFDVKDFMHAWISQSGYPALQELHNGDSTWWEQQRFYIDGTTDDTKWPLPEIKNDMSGHYLIDLSEDEFQDKMNGFDSLKMEQKLRLLIDRMMLAKASNVPTDSLVEILPKSTQEDASTWSILLDIINDLKIFFPPDTSEEDIYREYLRNIIYTRVREVGVQSKPNDSSDEKRLRGILAVIARFARDEEIIQELADQYQAELSKIDPEMRGNILMARMLVAENETFAVLLDKYKTESDPETKDDILGALGSAREEDNITVALGLLEKPEIVRPQDHYYLFIYLLRNAKARSRTLDWLYAHWDEVEKMAGEKNLEYYPRGIAGCITTPEEAKQFYEFFDGKKDDPALKRTLETARTSIDARLSLIASEGTSVQNKVQAKVAEMRK